jgi:hypothetical protein
MSAEHALRKVSSFAFEGSDITLQATQIMAQDARFVSRSISVCCACPGSVSTDMNPFGKNTAAHGAAAIAWLVNHLSPSHLHGKFWCEHCELPY